MTMQPLELYGRFDDEFVDEIVTTLLATIEQSRRRERWALDS